MPLPLIPAPFIIVLSRMKLRPDFKPEVQQINLGVFHGGLLFPHALEPLEIGQQAKGHHLERLGVKVAEVEPVWPDRVEVLVEFPDFRDGLELVWVVVPAVHQELETAHHRRELRTCRQRGRAEGLEEMGELALAHLFFAEDEYQGVFVQRHERYISLGWDRIYN